MARSVWLVVVLLAACGGNGTWVKAAALPNAAVDCRSAVVVGDALFVGNEHGLAKSPDDGVSWAEATNGLPHPNGFSPVEALLQDQDTLLAATDDGVYASGDNAATWANASAGLPGNVIPAALFQTGRVALLGLTVGSTVAGRSGGLFRSPDQGVSWDMSSGGLPEADGAIAFTTVGSNVITCSGQSLAVSSDQGQSWNVSVVPGSSQCLGLGADDTAAYAATSTGLLKSTDGATWTAASKGLPAGDSVTAVFANAGKLYAGTGSHGVFVSSDGGKSWSKDSDGLGTSPPKVVGFVVHGTTLIAITQNAGVWRQPL